MNFEANVVFGFWLLLFCFMVETRSKFMLLLEHKSCKRSKNEIKSKAMSSFIVSPDVPVIYQYPVLPTGCEATSLTYDSHGNGAMVLAWQLLLFLFLILSFDMCLSHTQKMSSFILSLLACSQFLKNAPAMVRFTSFKGTSCRCAGQGTECTLD